MSSMDNDNRALLLEATRFLADEGLAPATGGNFSVRDTAESFFITRSGVDKRRLTGEDLLLCDRDGTPRGAGLARPSAETAIHAALYSLADPPEKVAAVLHTHSVPATVLSNGVPLSKDGAGEIRFSGYEMQKSIAGCHSHLSELVLPVLRNSQEMEDIVSLLREDPARFLAVPGFVLAGHGLYTWGSSVAEARRHCEGFEFLLNCELHRRMVFREIPGGNG
ncbi:methylthioribulose 1-phosphate dehydratase [bacterium]|nr:methylthioribulose 1-phosphate dehydratase [bacterium]